MVASDYWPIANVRVLYKFFALYKLFAYPVFGRIEYILDSA